jgi:putative ABC transport system substrate-binding protein
MDASLKGFKEGLTAAGFKEGDSVTYDVQNAQGDQSNCVTVANTLTSKKPDLILAIATPIAQAVAKADTTTPVLVTAVTDPAQAKLVDSNEKPGGNITGTSDKTPVEEQIKLIKQVVSNVDTVGIMYCSSETNSKLQADWAKAACTKNGLKYKEFTVSAANEIQQVSQSMIGKVQAVYIPTDNMLASGMKVVTGVTTPAKLPVFVGESGMVSNGGVLTVGINYEELGKQTGAMAAKILKGESKPADMPIEYQKQYDVSYNSAVAKQLGLTLPDSITKSGKDVSSESSSSSSK